MTDARVEAAAKAMAELMLPVPWVSIAKDTQDAYRCHAAHVLAAADRAVSMQRRFGAV